jgi:hypothetical protein
MGHIISLLTFNYINLMGKITNTTKRNAQTLLVTGKKCGLGKVTGRNQYYLRV